MSTDLRLAYNSLGEIVGKLSEMPGGYEVGEAIHCIGLAMAHVGEAIEDEAIDSSEMLSGNGLTLLAKSLLALPESPLRAEIQAFLRSLGYPEPEAEEEEVPCV